MLALNLANKEISSRLGVSVNTVKFHLYNVYKKTEIGNRAAFVHRIAEIVNAKGATQGAEPSSRTRPPGSQRAKPCMMLCGQGY
jgi:hypothetical protein